MKPPPPFAFDERLSDILESRESVSWEGAVWRHMFGDIPPSRSNVRGARWNPPGVEAIYTSLDEDTVLAEAEHAMSLQPVRSTSPRKVYRLRVRLSQVSDLRDRDLLDELGVTTALAGLDFAPTQQIGGIAAWLGRDGLMVPSARHSGGNLVIFPTNRDDEAIFEVVEVQSLGRA